MRDEEEEEEEEALGNILKYAPSKTISQEKVMDEIIFIIVSLYYFSTGGLTAKASLQIQTDSSTGDTIKPNTNPENVSDGF